MGIISTRNPTYFTVGDQDIRVRVLPLLELFAILKKSLIDSGVKERGPELEALVTASVEAFDYSASTVEPIIMAACVDVNEGFDKDDAAMIASHEYIEVAYRMFKYAIYANYDDGKKKKVTKKAARKAPKKGKKAKPGS